MITKIIQISDVHIRNFTRAREYQEQLNKLFNLCKDIVKGNGVEHTRIVVCGDILHGKTEISPEGYAMASWFLKNLDKICTTIVFSGNHDINTGNSNNRLDPLSVIFSMSSFTQTHYLDKDLGYKSGLVEDDNIMWCLYSVFDRFAKPVNLAESYINNKDGKTFIGLFHGELKNAVTNTGYVSENGTDTAYFDNIDFGLLGHLHRRQVIKNNGVPLVYAGSVIQQEHGENISKHGFLVWDVENQTFEEVDIDNPDNGFYTFEINAESDIDEDLEEVINL